MAPTRESTSKETSRYHTLLFWILAVSVWAAGAYVWWGPRSELPEEVAGPPIVLPGDDVDPQQVVASPPVDGPPSAADLDRAISKGVQAYVDLYVRPSFENAAEGGYLTCLDSAGKPLRIGPDVYAQCQLYLLVHFLLYLEDWGIAEQDPLVQGVREWFLSTFDAVSGRWPWSDEGCLHPKSMIVLGQMGRATEFQSAWEWARTGPLFRPEEGLFSIMRSGYIVQTLGAAELSLSQRLEWEHGGPHPDEENTAKFIFALLKAGYSPDDPQVRSLVDANSRWIAQHPLALGEMNSHHLIGRVWHVFLHLRYRLPPDDGYRMSLAFLRAAARGDWRHNYALRAIPLFRALVVRALLEAGIHSESLDAMVHGFVASQEEDGAWRLPHTYSVWGLHQAPAKGYKYGNMDGANTYMVALALIDYRRWRGR